MSLPSYPEYRDSGVAWLGHIPRHWEAVFLKRVIEAIDSGVSVNSIDTPAEENELGVLKTSCVYRGEFDPSENKAVIPEEHDRLACQVRAGTLIVSRMNTPELVGAAGVVRQNIANLFLPDRLWQVYFKDAVPAYVHYWCQTPIYRAQVQSACAGTSSSMQNLSQDEFRRFVLALPPICEQSTIATFLDRETAKIDGLISQQEKLIALLAEKRQATISHAVTKGLNPDAPMKDSGVPWLGEVPAHWEVVGLTKYIQSVIDYRGRTPTKVDDGVFLVTAKNIRNGAINYEASQEYISASEYADVMRRGSPEVGDVLFTTEAPLGQVAQVDRTDIALAQRIIKFRGDAEILDNSYLKFWVMGSHCQFNLETLATGSTALGIKGSKVGQVRLCLPPIDEQTAINFFLDAEIKRLDALATAAIRGIALLKERRSALISAAVTGKVDVRPPAETEAA